MMMALDPQIGGGSMGPHPGATASGELGSSHGVRRGGPQLPMDIEDDPAEGQDGESDDDEEYLCFRRAY